MSQQYFPSFALPDSTQAGSTTQTGIGSMIAEQTITDSGLLQTLRAAQETRKQCLETIALFDEHSRASTNIDLDEAILQQERRLNAHLAVLRGLNRKAVLGVRPVKQETNEARQEIDGLHLQLQNLYYEQRHLRGEIRSAESYDHKHMRLPMVSVEEFIAQHPEHAASSEHDLTLARIKDEHEARLALEGERLELVKRKEALLKETGAKKEELNKLDTEIEKWIGGQESVKKIFDAREKKLAERLEKEEQERAATEQKLEAT